MKQYLLSLTNFIMNNFFVSIKSIELYHSTIYSTKIVDSYFFIILRLVPFTLLQNIFEFLKIKYIYKLNNNYYSNYSNHFNLRPTILNFIVKNELSTSNNIFDKFKLYHLSVPFWFFINNEKLNTNDSFEIKYFSKGKMINQENKFKNFESKLLVDLFE